MGRPKPLLRKGKEESVSSYKLKPGQCANCNTSLDNSSTTTMVSSFVAFHPMKLTERKVTIVEAVLIVFEAALKKNKVSLPSELLSMCNPCIFALSELYRFYREFMELSKENSFIHDIIMESILWHGKGDSPRSISVCQALGNTKLSDNDLDADDEDEFLETLYPNIKMQIDKPIGKKLIYRPKVRNSKVQTSRPDVQKRKMQIDMKDIAADVMAFKSKVKKESEDPKRVSSRRGNRSVIEFSEEQESGKVENNSKPKHRVTTTIPKLLKRRVKVKKPWRTENNSSVKPENASSKTCHICGKYFRYPYVKDRHIMVIHENVKPFQCQYCDKKFAVQWFFDQHIKTIHTKEVTAKTFPCKINTCDRVFKAKHHLERHELSVHSPQKNFVCEKCDKSFKLEYYLKRHERGHYKDQPKKRLPGASRGNSSQSKSDESGNASKSPKKRRVGQIKKPWRVENPAEHPNAQNKCCPVCGKYFRYPYIMERHVMVIHQQTKPYKCKFCGKCFGVEWYCLQHEKTHTGELEEKTFPCKVCKKEFKFRTHLVRHENSIHSDARPFICEKCGKAYKTKDRLKDHIRRHDLIEVPRSFACSQCDKAFSDRNYLRNHVKTHTDEKPFLCSVCGMSFRQKPHLTRHIESKHKLDFPYKCNVCNKEFKRKDHLSQHLRGKTHGKMPLARNTSFTPSASTTPSNNISDKRIYDNNPSINIIPYNQSVARSHDNIVHPQPVFTFSASNLFYDF